MPPENEAFGNAPPLPLKSNDSPSNQYEQDKNNFGSRPPSYNLSDNNMTRSSGGDEKKQHFQSAPTRNDSEDLDDDLGLPSVPVDSYPNNYMNKNDGGSGGQGPASKNNNSNQPSNDQSASIDFDELTKRFNNLKSFK